MIEACLSLARTGGTVLFYGVAGTAGPHPGVAVRDLPARADDQGSFAEIDSFPAALVALRSGRARTDGIITHRFDLDQYGDALDAVRGDSSAHKVVITP